MGSISRRINKHLKKKGVRQEFDIRYPAVIYKYMESKYVSDFLCGKSVWIGTLYDFRDVKHGQDKSDPMENAVGIKGNTTWNTSDPDKAHILNYFEERGGVFFGNTFQGNKNDILFNGSDDYVYCVSTKHDEQISVKLDVTYDCCVKISNPKRFFQSMTAAMNSKFGLVKYKIGYLDTTQDRIFSPSDRTADFNPDPFKKGTKFKDLKEYRIIFRVKNSILKPFALTMDMTGCKAEVCWTRSTSTK